MNYKDRRKLISERLKFELEHCNITIKEIATRLGVYQSLISEYKSGKKMPSVEKLSLLCEIIDADANYILGLTEN